MLRSATHLFCYLPCSNFGTSKLGVWYKQTGSLVPPNLVDAIISIYCGAKNQSRGRGIIAAPLSFKLIPIRFYQFHKPTRFPASSKLLKSQNKQSGELNPFENIKMLVIGNNVSSISCKSTIHELVVIMVCLNQPKLKIGCDQLDVFAFQ